MILLWFLWHATLLFNGAAGFPKNSFPCFFRTWCFVYNSWWENWRIGSFWLLKFSILSRTLKFDELICTNGSLLTAFTKKSKRLKRQTYIFGPEKTNLAPGEMFKKKRKNDVPKKSQKEVKDKLMPEEKKEMSEKRKNN